MESTEPADAKKPDWVAQHPRRKNPRNKRNNQRLMDLEIQEHCLLWKERQIPESECQTSGRQDNAGEWHWIERQEPPQGCQTWLEQKLLNRQLDLEQKRLEAEQHILLDWQVKICRLSEWINRAQTATLHTLQMREYAVATHEAYWPMMSHQQTFY